THDVDISSPAGQSEVTVSFGVRKSDGQNVFGMWVEPQIQKEWLILNATTGIALPLSGPVELDFTLEAGFSIDTETFDLPWKDLGPELNLSLGLDSEGQYQFSLSFYPLADA